MFGRMRVFAALVRAFAWLVHVAAFGSPVHAQAPVSLAWHAPIEAGCTTPDEIQRRVARLTDRQLTLGEVPGAYRIVADLDPYDAAWRARVSLSDARGRNLGSREMHGRLPDCQALDVPVVLVIATMLDDLRDRELAKARAEGEFWQRLGLGASFTYASGFVPRPWFGVTFLVAVPVSRLNVTIDASAYWPREELDAQGRGVRASGFHAGLGVCPALYASHALRIGVCIAAEVGALWAAGVGLTRNDSGLLPRLLLGLEPTISLKLAESLALQLSGAGAWVPFRHPFGWLVNNELRTLAGDSFVLMARVGLITFPQ